MSPTLSAALEGAGKIAFIWGVVLAAMLPNLIWMERRVAGLIQDRPGPNRVGPFGLLQAIADTLKMFMKEDVVPLYADRVLHTLAPFILLVPAMATFAVIPFGSKIPLFGREIPLVVADVNIGILYVFALASVGVYGIVLAGWASNNKFALMGGIRSSAQVISYELSMGLAAIATLMAAGSLRLTRVVEYQATGTFLGFLPTWNCFTQPLGCIIFIVAAFAETNRVPFDLPEAEAELVAGYHTEYSGFRFGAFFMAEYLNLVASSMMMATLYFGGWSLPFLPSRRAPRAASCPSSSSSRRRCASSSSSCGSAGPSRASGSTSSWTSAGRRCCLCRSSTSSGRGRSSS